ncbi:hypothetical protein [Psychroflexus salis]|uniref:Sulfotransferase domain-containing protein n=1 Tax=Psychroflexus salis TaxID=1526574 RepID=A0A917E513_9FLAO|nr:hypothetical protein [Psychroflexus salis]GGE05079.1 hypothetical protein GCM10010831_03420 [Psychroflexus salis]
MINNLILNGYDRSGTSAISRTLSKHPDVELVFRPFNSGSIRKKMYKILDDSNTNSEDNNFFSNLEKGIFIESYIKSEWHFKYSTVEGDFHPNNFHIIITNINHFSIPWVNKNYPKIEQWAIWRDPIEILNSCVKNKFYGKWYKDAFDELDETLNKNDFLKELFYNKFTLAIKSNYVVKTAFLIAVRNYVLFKYISKSKIIDYNIFEIDPNKALNGLLKHFNLKDFDFKEYLKVDLNSISSIDGFKPSVKKPIILDKNDLTIAKDFFKPLYEIYNTKTQ